MFKKKLVKWLEKKIKEDIVLETPPSKDMGDYALACFPFCKKLRKDPKKIALEYATVLHLEKPGYIEKIISLSGYVNFFLKTKVLAKKVIEKISKDKNNYGKTNIGRKKQVMLEFSAPNTNKPMHLGHLRNNLLGDCLSNIFDYEGYKVIRANLINDRGIHICKSMLAYKKWGKGKTPKSENMKGDHFVGYYYVLYQQKLKEDPKLEQAAQRLLKKWEKGDEKTIALWKKMRKWCLQGFNETYKTLGVKFDKIYYESTFWKKAKNLVLRYYKKGQFIEGEDGELLCDLEKYNLPNKVVLRADKTTLYSTQDIYLAIQKFKDYNLEKSIYVVAREQEMYFRQLFAILRKLGYKWWEKCLHFSYGMINLPEGKMKSREGTVVDIDDLITVMKDLAKIEIKQRHDEMEEAELEKRSSAIGLAALRFFLLKIDAVKDMIFNPTEAIPFEGDTGPYVQYTYARASSILRRVKGVKGIEVQYELVREDVERELVKKLEEFPEIVENSCNNLRPHLIAQYLTDLCRTFNDFYQKCKCLQAEEDIKAARIKLVKVSTIVIKNALTLLGIKALEEM